MVTTLTRRRGLVRRAALSATGVVGYLALVKVWDPFAPHLLQCPLHATTGLLCPGCGSTRAAYAFLHGDVTAALRSNALLPLAVVVIAYCLVFAPERIPARWIRVGAVLAVGFAVVRNLPAFQFLTPPASL